MPTSPEFLGESLDVSRPLREHEAVPAAFQRRRHVGDHLGGADIVRDHQPVAAGECGDVVLTGQGLQHRDVDHAMGFRAAATELPRLDTQQLTDSGSPLVGKGFAVEEHER